ncbi:MAG: NifU N-terminal domain-containing protein [Actinomycetota bacterium]|nr:NifU N-terminal domain-containing protein [Actinomycetota bacterium]
MATVSPSPTPNPNAMKFTLDKKLPATMNFGSAEAAKGNAFAEAVFKTEGVVQVFGVNDFVTFTRRPVTDLDPIVKAVTEAAAEHL